MKQTNEQTTYNNKLTKLTNDILSSLFSGTNKQNKTSKTKKKNKTKKKTKQNKKQNKKTNQKNKTKDLTLRRKHKNGFRVSNVHSIQVL